jgi:polysaccharide chain length determinant protein (PEP-CTERM system associated)
VVGGVPEEIEVTVLPGRKYAIEDFLRIAWRRKWLILLPFLVVSIGTFLFVRRMPDVYRSETTILVIPQRVPESYVRSTITDRIGDRLQSLKEQILSRSRLERTIVDLNLFPGERRTGAMEDLINHMRNAVMVETARSDAFTVSYSSPDPRTAQIVTERLASDFIRENVIDREKLADTTSEFLKVQAEDAKRQLIEQEKKLEAYRLAHAGELPSQAASNLQGLQSGRVQLQTVVDSINRDRDRQLIKERELADLLAPEPAPQPAYAAAPGGAAASSSGPGAPALAPAEELAQATAQLRVMDGRLTDAHPDVRQLRRRVAQLTAQVEAVRAEEPSPAPAAVAPPPAMTAADLQRDRRIRDTRAELEALNRRILAQQKDQQRLLQETALYQARLEAAPVRESELIELMRDYETLQELYRSLLTKREDSKIAANLERRNVGEQFRVLDPALVPQRPFSPDRLKLNAVGIFLGLLIGVGIVAALEFMDTTLKSEEDIRTILGLPVIATIPVFAPKVGAGAMGQRIRGRLTGAGAAVLAAGAAIAWSLR